MADVKEIHKMIDDLVRERDNLKLEVKHLRMQIKGVKTAHREAELRGTQILNDSFRSQDILTNRIRELTEELRICKESK